jgi:hypothetical protein
MNWLEWRPYTVDRLNNDSNARLLKGLNSHSEIVESRVSGRALPNPR